MDVIDSKTTNQLLLSLLAEVAKATNELRCAQADVNKAQSRLQFSVAVLNQLIERTKD
jgi:hypothetical protein